MKGGAARLGAALLVLWALVSLAPLLWMTVGAFLPGEALLGDAAALAAGPTWENFLALTRHGHLATWILNSALVAGGASLGQVVLAAALGWVLAKRDFGGRKLVLGGLGLLMTVPGQVLVIPLFVLVTRLDLVDSLLGAALPALVTPFGVLLMYTRMLTIPDELIDAARVDGCSELGLFFRVALPLATPAAATLAIFGFVAHWNSFLWPLLVLLGSERYTLSVGLATLQGQHQLEYGLLFAGAAVSALPMVLFFLVFQRAFSRGMMAGAVKG